MCNEIYVEILEDKQSDQISLLRQHITTTVTTQILILTGTEGREGPVCSLPEKGKRGGTQGGERKTKISFPLPNDIKVH